MLERGVDRVDAYDDGCENVVLVAIGHHGMTLCCRALSRDESSGSLVVDAGGILGSKAGSLAGPAVASRFVRRARPFASVSASGEVTSYGRPREYVTTREQDVQDEERP